MEITNRPPEDVSASFFTQEERVLADIAGGSGFSFKRGDEWSINPETGSATFDPKFFTERGYTPSQALFASMHEIKCHLVEVSDLLDTKEGSEEYSRLKQRIKKQRFKIWENCRTDVKGNLAITEFAPALADDAESVYKEKLWPTTDFTDKPKHLQFMYAILRQAMVPGEELTVDPTVTEEIDKLRHVQGKDGKIRDVIALSTDPHVDPLLALKLSNRYIEPVIDRLFEGDVEEKKGKGKGEKDKKGKEKGNPQDAFKDDYAEYDEKHPEPFNEKEIEKKIRQAKASQSTSSRQQAGYSEEHGVSPEDIVNYYNEYQKIEPYIEPLRQIFRKIIEKRQIPIRHLAALKEEGVMIDPGLVTQTYLDVRAGVSNPKTMKDFEGVLIDENIPTSFEVTVVGDRTGSMREGSKIPEQRRTGVLLMEALKEFSDVAEEQGPLAPELTIKSEIRSFGDNPNHAGVLKSLSHALTEQDRIGVFKALGTCDSGTNNEEVMFDQLFKSIQEEARKDPTYLERIKSGKLRKFVIILTDGQVGNYEATRNQIKKLRDFGVVVAGVGITEDGKDAVKTYAPDGQVARQASDLPRVLQNLLAEYLGTLSVGENVVLDQTT